MTRATLRKFCKTDGCTEVALYDFSSQRERAEHVRREKGRPWHCTRHVRPDEVVTPSQPSREVVVTAERSQRFPKVTKLFWREGGAADVGSGFIFGPGFKAWADDFPEGTRLRITVETCAPDPTPAHPQSDGSK